ncbi:hypothetical protein [Azospirillum melinis]
MRGTGPLPADSPSPPRGEGRGEGDAWGGSDRRPGVRDA